jgi:hypothetical protein
MSSRTAQGPALACQPLASRACLGGADHRIAQLVWREVHARQVSGAQRGSWRAAGGAAVLLHQGQQQAGRAGCRRASSAAGRLQLPGKYPARGGGQAEEAARRQAGRAAALGRWRGPQQAAPLLLRAVARVRRIVRRDGADHI